MCNVTLVSREAEMEGDHLVLWLQAAITNYDEECVRLFSFYVIYISLLSIIKVIMTGGVGDNVTSRIFFGRYMYA